MPDKTQPTENANDGETTTTATSAGQTISQPASQSTGEKTPVTTRTFTQEEVDTIMGRTRAESRDRATAGLIKELGATDLDQLKDMVKSYNQIRQEQMSDIEKLTEETERLRPLEKQTKDQEKQLKAYEKTLQAHVENLMETMSVPEHVKTLLEKMPTLERLAYLTEHGKAFATPPAGNTNAADKGSTNSKQNAKERAARIRQKYGIQY